jgi:hypothetical protein
MRVLLVFANGLSSPRVTEAARENNMTDLSGYDLIGDIHGHAGPLARLLEKLGYRDQDGSGVWSHSERKVIFLGDFIDRGPKQLETVQMARSMVENGTALAVMGNHEFNAILYASEHPDGSGQFLRERSDKNRNQHRAFLTAVDSLDPSGVSDPQREIVEWFKTLPVYLDLPGLRVIHACWHPDSIAVLGDHLDERQRICEDSWSTLAQKGSPAYEAAEILLKGWEIRLPENVSFLDKDRNRRVHIRTRWWETAMHTYRGLAIVPADVIGCIPDSQVEADVLPGYDGHKPLFLGHYWLDGDPKPLSDHIACLDYSIAREDLSDSTPGKLCAYRWNGEEKLKTEHFTYVAG